MGDYFFILVVIPGLASILLYIVAQMIAGESQPVRVAADWSAPSKPEQIQEQKNLEVQETDFSERQTAVPCNPIGEDSVFERSDVQIETPTSQPDIQYQPPETESDSAARPEP